MHLFGDETEDEATLQQADRPANVVSRSQAHQWT